MVVGCGGIIGSTVTLGWGDTCGEACCARVEPPDRAKVRRVIRIFIRMEEPVPFLVVTLEPQLSFRVPTAPQLTTFAAWPRPNFSLPGSSGSG